MVYVFENENAVELYYVITKQHGIPITPGEGFQAEGCVHFTEKVLMTFLQDIVSGQYNRRIIGPGPLADTLPQ